MAPSFGERNDVRGGGTVARVVVEAVNIPFSVRDTRLAEGPR
ncbi:hypothetical protein [Natrinema gelatinilyticum]|nr:hypothetical protein [Natrinema gelatinilyticum]